jgi:hypothetical protein
MVLECPYFNRISGARYAIDPTKELLVAAEPTFSLLSPKSVSFACPSLSITTFPGLRSLKIILFL